MPLVARCTTRSERDVVDPEKRDEVQGAAPGGPVRRLTSVGLSPTVERMFGALIEDQVTAGAQPTSEPEAQRTSRPGAA